jgi:hypothetical protein
LSFFEGQKGRVEPPSAKKKLRVLVDGRFFCAFCALLRLQFFNSIFGHKRAQKSQKNGEIDGEVAAIRGTCPACDVKHAAGAADKIRVARKRVRKGSVGS